MRNYDENSMDRFMTKQHSISMSKIKLIDPETDKPGKVFIGYTQEGSRVRVFRKTNSILALPSREHLKYNERVESKVMGQSDTFPIDVLEVRVTRSLMPARTSRA